MSEYLYIHDKYRHIDHFHYGIVQYNGISSYILRQDVGIWAFKTVGLRSALPSGHNTFVSGQIA